MPQSVLSRSANFCFIFLRLRTTDTSATNCTRSPWAGIFHSVTWTSLRSSRRWPASRNAYRLVAVRRSRSARRCRSGHGRSGGFIGPQAWRRNVRAGALGTSRSPRPHVAPLQFLDGLRRLRPALWAAMFYILIDLLKHDRPELKHWLTGMAAGTGLMTKGSMLFYGFALAVALLLTPRRTYYARKGIWISFAVALAVSSYLIWQHLHGWPVIEYWGLYGRTRTYSANPSEYFLMQVITLNPLSLPVRRPAVFSSNGPTSDSGRLGGSFPVVFVTCLILSTKFFMVTASFFPLLAAGSVQAEKLSSRGRRLVRPAYIGLYLFSSVLLVLAVVPLLLPRALSAGCGAGRS